MTNIIIFDFNRTLYDPETDSLMEGAFTVLEALFARGEELHLVSRQEGGREDLLQRLGIDYFFTSVHFVPEKTRAHFQDIIASTSDVSREVYVVGDYLKSEIALGNQCGAKTLWLKRGAFADDMPLPHEEPWRTIHSLKEILDHV